MIELIQNWIEETYRLDRHAPVSSYLIDHAEVLHYLGKDHPLCQAEEVVLMTGKKPNFHLGIYLHPALLVEKESESLQARSHRYLTTAEGISHLLCLAHKLKEEEEVSQLELQLQAEVDKYFYAKVGAPAELAIDPNYHLDRAASLDALPSKALETYETARRMAYRYCMELEKEYLCVRSFDGLFQELRGFYRMSHWKKIQRIGLP